MLASLGVKTIINLEEGDEASGVPAVLVEGDARVLAAEQGMTANGLGLDVVHQETLREEQHPVVL